jgi:hypothetical protein
MSTEQVELRAERLRVALQLLDISDDMNAGLYPEPRPLFRQHDLALARTLSSRDRALAQACLDVERGMRRREWVALEALLPAIPPGGEICDIYDLPADQAVPALRAAQACGWLREAAE